MRGNERLVCFISHAEAVYSYVGRIEYWMLIVVKIKPSGVITEEKLNLNLN